METFKEVGKVTVGILAGVALVLVYQALAPVRIPPAPPRVETAVPVEGELCRGEAIAVDVPFDGSMLEPWTCKVQCDDGKLRYILYNDGQATPCEALPGCTDWGEDNNVTCVPPGNSKKAASDSRS